MFKKYLCAVALTSLATSGVQAAEQGQDTYSTGMTATSVDSTGAAASAADTGMDAAATADTATEAAAAPVTSNEWLDDRFYLAPFGTFMQPGGDRKAFGGWGGGLAIGKILNQYFNVELRGFWLGYGNNIPQGGAIGGNTDLTGGTVDLQYHFMRSADNPFSPYVVAALGGVNESWRTGQGQGRATSQFLFQTGLGATYELADNFLLRGDVRYQLQTAPNRTLTNPVTGDVRQWGPDVYNDLVVNAGFVIPLGEKPQPIAAAAPAPVDDCSTRDSDGDGVNDCDDKCPGTMKGAKVDEYGCLVRIELRGVNFHYDSAELTESAKAILDDVSAGLIASDEKKDIEVQGHTSTEGTDQYNMRLSQRRAASVVDYLKMKGVTNNLYPKGYGESYPKVSPDKTEAERAVNRRVELVWMGD
jgi:OOP family OmpA-OmpF porin